MAILNLEITDLDGGRISVKLTSNITDLENAPVTPAMIVMATLLDALQAEAEHQGQQKIKVH